MKKILIGILLLTMIFLTVNAVDSVPTHSPSGLQLSSGMDTIKMGIIIADSTSVTVNPANFVPPGWTVNSILSINIWAILFFVLLFFEKWIGSNKAIASNSTISLIINYVKSLVKPKNKSTSGESKISTKKT